MKRLHLLWALGAATAALGGAAGAVNASERQAVIEGVQDKTLRGEIERALSEEKAAPSNRVDARRRARAAADSATALLRSEGYYDYVVEPDIGEGERPTPVVTITPGPRTVLAPATVRFVGTPPAPAAQEAVVASLKLAPGAPARAAEVLAAEGRVLAAVQQAGYADAKAAPREVVIDHADHTAHVTLMLDAGGLVRLGAIRLSSKGRTRASWLRGLVPWTPGQVYKPALVAELERRLLDTRVYDSVTVALAPRDDDSGLRPVLVSVADRARNTLGVEAGYSSTEGGDVDLKLSQYDRFGVGDVLTYEVRYGAIDSRVGVEWALPHFWRPGQTLTSDVDFFQTVTNAYRETGFQLLGDLTQRFGRTTYITRGASVTASEVDDFQTGKIDIVTLRALGAFALDRSDNPLDPHTGFKLDGRAEPTLITLDETLAYLKIQGQFSSYLSIEPSAADVLAFRLHVGSIVGGSIPQVPAPDRFYAGGGGSVRGYTYQSVGPHYPDNVPVGGLSLVEGSVELRHRLTASLGGVLFVDTGSVGEQIAPDFRHTLSSVGVGLRYNLGFAPLRADLAFPLQKANGASQQAFQIYLSIGQSF